MYTSSRSVNNDVDMVTDLALRHYFLLPSAVRLIVVKRFIDNHLTLRERNIDKQKLHKSLMYIKKSAFVGAVVEIKWFRIHHN
ncbi:MAG: hypothetical protein JWN70_1569 [Planctomycetaceae bacterium]|nr:hypothetical protein [Planctomycetaceae bacterium]